MTTKEQILDLFSDVTFDGIFTARGKDIHKVIEYLPKSFEYDWRDGASKFVIIPDNTRYVIKIPYTGPARGNCEEYFEYANDTDQYYWDYCFTEMMMYREAKRYGVQDAFAKETLVGILNGQTIYMQEKVEVYGESGSSASERDMQKTSEYCDEHCCRKFNEDTIAWQADALSYYGEKKFNKIMNFLEDMGIGDLHEDNLGYIGIQPVILDYSNFNEV